MSAKGIFDCQSAKSANQNLLSSVHMETQNKKDSRAYNSKKPIPHIIFSCIKQTVNLYDRKEYMFTKY